jgi:hypothetical protein
MVDQGARAVIDGVLVHRTVRVYVRNHMLACDGPRVAMVACGRLRDEGPLEGKRHRRRHHHDVDEPAKPGERTSAQHVTST